MTISILQEFWSAAIAGSSGWHRSGFLKENVGNVAYFATSVKHAVLREEPFLQFVTHLAATMAQRFYSRTMVFHLLRQRRKRLLRLLLEASQLRFHVLAFLYHGSLLVL